MNDSVAARAVAHPVRAQALEMLAQRPGTPREISLRIGAPLTAVSYHVRMLLQLGLVELVEVAPRGASIEHRYRARARVRVTIEPL
jgi:DNA-binding transcriptional ArsR family regulator